MHFQYVIIYLTSIGDALMYPSVYWPIGVRAIRLPSSIKQCDAMQCD